MKYIVVVCDGMADEPHPLLNGKTPLKSANKPYLDRLASDSLLGTVQTIPTGFTCGSDVAHLELLGYDTTQLNIGRGALEAFGLSLPISPNDIVYRCNFISLSDESDFSKKTLLSHCSKKRTAIEKLTALEILHSLLPAQHTLYHDKEYRNLLVCKSNEQVSTPTSPDCWLNKAIGESFSANFIRSPYYELMKKASNANVPIWIWGGGTLQMLPSFAKLHECSGVIITGTPLIAGIGKLCAMDTVIPDGATGDCDTNFDAKVSATIDTLKTHDFALLHLEALDECSHQKDPIAKVNVLETIDSKVIKPLIEQLACFEDYRLLILSDHVTSSLRGTHTSAPVPFLIYRKSMIGRSNQINWSEFTPPNIAQPFQSARELINFFLHEV